MRQPQRPRRKAIVLSSDEEEVVKKPPSDKLKRRTESTVNTSQTATTRRNRAAIVESSSEDGLSQDLASVQRSTRNTKPSPSKQSRSSKEAAKPSPGFSSTPDAQNGAAKPNSQKEARADNARSKDKKIYSFFNTATQKQQSQRSSSPDKLAKKIVGEEDLIEDDSFGEDLAALEGNATTNSLTMRGKRKRDQLDDTGPLGNDGVSLGSQKFIKTGNAPIHPVDTFPEQQPFEDLRPWTELHGPENISELAVHAKKVKD
ncbi:hypothetical protein LTS18_000604, partial [Coniosporium uncinatum]